MYESVFMKVCLIEKQSVWFGKIIKGGGCGGRVFFYNKFSLLVDSR